MWLDPIKTLQNKATAFTNNTLQTASALHGFAVLTLRSISPQRNQNQFQFKTYFHGPNKLLISRLYLFQVSTYFCAAHLSTTGTRKTQKGSSRDYTGRV